MRTSSTQVKSNLAFNPIRSLRFGYHRFLGLLAIVSSGINRQGQEGLSL